MDQDLRINALCNRLGHLWTRTKRAVVDEVVTEISLKEGERTAFGRLHGNLDVNFQAFQTTMKKAWKTEKVVFTHLELGLFSFVFETVEEKCRILDNGPWSFSRHILVLKPWEPSFVPQCHGFTSCAFWLHIIGLPVEGRKTEVLSSIAEQVGRVEEVRMEAKGYAGIAVCKVKVILDLLAPLEPGMIYSYKGKELWIDFRYERLPTFCFSCRKMGHYAQNCIEIPYDEEKFASNDNIFYGTWLKTEMNTPSPYWKSFYEAKIAVDMEEETIPETPEVPNSTNNLQRAEGNSEKWGTVNADRGKRKISEVEGLTQTWDIPNQVTDVAEAGPLLLELPSFHGESSLRKNHRKLINREKKKGRKMLESEEKNMHIMMLDDADLLEIPVNAAEDLNAAEALNIRALVACPNKLLSDK